jgi:aquaporin Z
MTRSSSTPPLATRLLAEAAGTFILVFGVVGTALISAGFDQGTDGLNVGFLGVAIALGLSVFVAATSFGPISGGHFNPAVTIGLAVAHRFSWREVGLYATAQVTGGLVASSLLAAIANGGPDDYLATVRMGGFASTGWGTLSPGNFSLVSALIVEAVATGILMWVVLATTHQNSPAPLAPLAIGLTLTVLALVAIPVSNGSFNPARSIATAAWGGETAIDQLWLSLLAPIAGAALAALVFSRIFGAVRRRLGSEDDGG